MNLLKEKKYPIYLFNTDTSGEKLYEEFYTDDEYYELDKYNALGVISKKAKYSIIDFNKIIEDLKYLLLKEETAKPDIITWLKKYIPEFQHIETGKKLDNKM